MEQTKSTQTALSDRLLKGAQAAAQQHQLFDGECAALLMVSGGSDSTALAYMMATLREEGAIGALAMLHVNHKLRGQDAEDDAAFVAQLARHLDVPLFACEVDVAGEARRFGENVEAVGRRERYRAADEALLSMCQHEAYPLAKGRIVTAHTVDDRVENFYMRSIVGTGPGGFRSMLYRNGPIVRPLLDLFREDLRTYISELPDEIVVHDGEGARWREDATNAHTDRFRSYVRHEIVPEAKQWNPQLCETLTRTMNLIAEEDDMLEAMASELIEGCVQALGEDASDGFLLLPPFGSRERPLQRRAVHRLLKAMLGADARVDTAAVEGVLDAFVKGKPLSGHVDNIQGDLAVSANKQGVRVEPMAAFRARRKKG